MDGPRDASAIAGVAEGCRKCWVHYQDHFFLGGAGAVVVVGGETKAHYISLPSMELSRANWP